MNDTILRITVSSRLTRSGTVSVYMCIEAGAGLDEGL